MENKDEPAVPLTTSKRYYPGMSKFEHVKLEVLKAMLSNPNTNNGHIAIDVSSADMAAKEFFK